MRARKTGKGDITRQEKGNSATRLLDKRQMARRPVGGPNIVTLDGVALFNIIDAN